MWKLYLTSAFLLAGCSTMEFNATMCDEVASDHQSGGSHECRNYVKEDAQKAFDKVNDKQESRENVLKFSKDNDDKEN